MRLGVCHCIRKARRSGIASLFPRATRLRSRSPKKHIKIDDEERDIGGGADIFTLHGRPSGSIIRKLRMLLLACLLFLLLVLFLAHIVYKPPTILIRYFQWRNPDVLFHVPLPSSQRVVALTLDDAPSDETAKILDLLKLYGAKATFFAIGSQISSHPEILQRIHDEGHEIGNHAFEDEPSFQLPLAELERQIKDVETMIPANPDGAKYFRPGSGVFNKAMVKGAKSLGYRVVLGSIYPHDPQIHSARVNSRHVLSMVKPGGIIIMHDRRSYSAEQLELVLKGLANKRWKVESIGGLLRIAASMQGKKLG